MSDKEFPSCAYDVCAEFDCEETMALALIATRKALEQSEICCTEWEKQALDYKAENIALSGELERTRKALELATERLQQIAHESFQGDQQSINMGFHIRAAAALTDIEQITALEQKDVK